MKYQRVCCLLVLGLCLVASCALANTTGGGGTMAEVKTEVSGLMSVVWLVIGAVLVIYGVYELIQFGASRSFTGGSLLGLASFVIVATMIVYVVPKYSTKAESYAATVDHISQEPADAIVLGE